MKDSIEFFIQFIAEIENNPELYDYGLADYGNKRITENIWTKIGKKFNERGRDCKTKWKSIRSAYIRSLQSKSKIGSAASSTKDYYLAPYLLFLTPFTKITRIQKSNILFIPATKDDRYKVDCEYEIKVEKTSNSEPDLSSADEEFLSHEEPAASCSESSPQSSSLPINTSQASKPRPKTLSEADKCAIEYYTLKKKKLEYQQHPETRQRDSCEMFLLSLAPHMSSMSQEQQLSFQRGALELIKNIKYGKE